MNLGARVSERFSHRKRTTESAHFRSENYDYQSMSLEEVQRGEGIPDNNLTKPIKRWRRRIDPDGG